MISESTTGNLFEVTPSGTVVWNYSPGGEIVRVLRYGHDYPGLAGLVGIQGNNETGIPKDFELSQNYPNPFNPSTIINYNLPKSSSISLKVYDMLGNEIKTLVSNPNQNAGSYNVEWDGKDERGVAASSGVYFYKLISADFNKTMKMILMK
ncbi:MAG: T9SS type A sorting domain-containing protein [Ignavibacteria bacterium]|nr:T9SS type A sorting domain-containing protein [Ignavibacteria bacterium]